MFRKLSLASIRLAANPCRYWRIFSICLWLAKCRMSPITSKPATEYRIKAGQFLSQGQLLA